jgi:hypothetical protein
LEAPEAEILTEVESGEPEPEESEPEEPDPIIKDGRPRRETRNHMPKYQDVMRFDDLEEPGSTTVPATPKRRRQSSQTVPLAATDEEEPQSRTGSPPAEAESGRKKPRGRRPGSGYVKDRWYYAPY